MLSISFPPASSALGYELFGSEPFDPESFDPELTTKGSQPKGSGRMELAKAGRRYRVSFSDILFPPAPGGVGGRNPSKAYMEPNVKEFTY